MSLNNVALGGAELTNYDENTRDMGFESPVYSPARQADNEKQQIMFDANLSAEESASPKPQDDDDDEDEGEDLEEVSNYMDMAYED